MKIPNFITHYFESDRGAFLNLCDLPDIEVQRVFDEEKNSEIAFNRFSLGSDFMRWRRSADDLLIRAYVEKFGFPPIGRPFFAVLGEFDKTLEMFRNGQRVRLELDVFDKHEITFMYPDHAHLTSYYGAEVPHLFYQLDATPENQPFRGKLFTRSELPSLFQNSVVGASIQSHLERDGWAGCYVEAHIWCRDKRTKEDEQGYAEQGIYI